MTRRRRRRRVRGDVVAPWILLAVIGAGWWAGAQLFAPPQAAGLPPATVAAAPDPVPSAPESTIDTVPLPPAPAVPPPAGAARTRAVLFEDLVELRARRLTVPVAGIAAADLVSGYHDARGSSRRHEALDLLAPRGTPVVAVEDGRIARLHTSDRGGLTIYQFDPGERFVYYYAHLDAYAPAIEDGAVVSRGQVLGYVGTTGNAPPDTPHLHFAISKLGPDREWWKALPIDPVLAWQ